MPAIVSTLKGVKIIDISCGGCLQIGDAFFMALTETGMYLIFSRDPTTNLKKGK